MSYKFLLLSIYMSLSSAYVTYLIISKLIVKIIQFVLRHRLDTGSENYLKFKNHLESCIKSGEINSYYSGFQFVKIDKSEDSLEMSKLQSDVCPLNRFEKYKLMIFGKSLIDQL